MSENQGKIITKAQLAEHASHKNLWIVISGQVYDVSKFMDEHPGGDEVLLCEAEKDATEAFEDVGHSDDARALLPPMLVGEIEGGGEAAKPKVQVSPVNKDPTSVTNSNPLFMFAPLLVLGVWVAYKYSS
ncbi:cytochrome b5 [Ceraceosorus guamensis]|uniref:Cytochrome b5 n=1 Tax=Ceraceosorus guamensis TaxID=1522189 RepID=A0A316W2F7_9BASI|nr:cytochrome b5 [Ceraceosorus guamensis]PWN42963.1 cytochrome b5 [Ceraceosorus guamensis]